MDNINDKIGFHRVEGSKSEPDIVLYALSTCAFCKKGMEYLESNGFAYQYAFVDQIDIEIKRELKNVLAEKFDVVAVFPILVVDDTRAYPGFTELIWSRAIGLK